MATNYNILYAEDDLDDLEMIADAFLKFTKQLRVIHAHNGLEALQILENMSRQMEFPCLIILDINMPLMNGRQALLEIKKNDKYKDIPIVMFSTSAGAADRKFARDMGVEFFAKPYSYVDLKKLVEELVQKCILEKKA